MTTMRPVPSFNSTGAYLVLNRARPHLNCSGRLGYSGVLRSQSVHLATRTGHQLHATAVKRAVFWSQVAPGRRIHDLRHTAARLWPPVGVDPVTVQAWLGHASIATTNIYLHRLGSSADRAGLERLNRLGGAGGCARRTGVRNDNRGIAATLRHSCR